MYDKTLIAIVGPTAIGKTALAIQVAKHYQTEIISADSRQFYTEMSIGTAKPSFNELAEVKHHFIGSHSIHENFNVGDFEKAALKTLENIFEKHNIAVLTGGSGLFIKAICSGFDELPPVSPRIRESLNQKLINEGLQKLQAKLKELDPVYYSEVDINNPQRVIRALEVAVSTGKPFSSFRLHNQKTRSFKIIKIGLNTGREQLYKQINIRVDQMMSVGLLEEAKSLVDFQHLNALKTVGYTELFQYLNGESTLLNSTDAIKQNTRRFAKRQLTWFRKDQEINWFKPEADNIISYLDSVI